MTHSTYSRLKEFGNYAAFIAAWLWLMIATSAQAADKWDAGYRAAAVLLDRGEYATVLERYRELLRWAEEAKDPIALSFSLHGIAYSLQELGRLDEALPLYQRTLAITRGKPVELLPLRLRALNNLTSLHLTSGQYGPAERSLHELAAIPELIQYPTEEALYRNNLGILNLGRGRLAAAEVSLREGFAIVEAKLKDDSRYAAGLLHSLGLLAEASGHPEEAAGYFERSIAMTSALYGPEFPPLAKTLLNLSAARLKLGDVRGSEEAAARSLAICEKHLGPAHPLTGSALLARAAALRKWKRTAEAKRLEKRGRAIVAAEEARRAAAPVVDVSALR